MLGGGNGGDWLCGRRRGHGRGREEEEEKRERGIWWSCSSVTVRLFLRSPEDRNVTASFYPLDFLIPRIVFCFCFLRGGKKKRPNRNSLSKIPNPNFIKPDRIESINRNSLISWVINQILYIYIKKSVVIIKINKLGLFCY